MTRKRVLRRISTVVAVMILSLALMAPSASAFPKLRTPNLVVLGDSYASGVGNYPYQDASPCKRSDISYGPILDRLHLVHLQALVACSGATTAQVWGPGPNGEEPQINSITADTDIITVQALGNDFNISTIEGLCLLPPTLGGIDCTRDTPIGPGLTIGSVIDSIPTVGAANLETLYSQIDAKRGPKSAVITVGYPNPVGNGGPLCPAVSTREIQFSAQLVTNLNNAIRTASAQHHYRFVSVDDLFRGHDACVLTPAIYPILPPGASPLASADPDFQGILHPNQLGQSIYAGAIASRLFF